MGRRPQEDDREEDNGFQRDRIGNSCPADHWRKGAGRAADDDVLRRRTLEQHRIDNDVEKDREGEQAGSQQIDHQAEGRDRKYRQEQAKGERFTGSNAA